MMINYQGEVFTETEFYGREILEAIQLTNKFPTPKKVLVLLQSLKIKYKVYNPSCS
ncbi:hypothetical protein [Lactococcus cremoris]|uniref:hypothetical protein n=1 Tax=Lactococcus lactis subsp. cremoris TaxID=1359 RepID=UPI0037BFE078